MAKYGAKIIWLMILLMLTAVMGEALISGDILLYLAPRMVPMVWFGFIILAGLGIYQLVTLVLCLRHAQVGEIAHLGMLLFLIPIVLILTAAPDANIPGSLPNQNLQIGNRASAGVEQDIEADGTIEEIDDGISYTTCIMAEEHALFNPSADQFDEYLRETAEALNGRTITVYGYVYWDESFPEDMVLVSRLMITCCAADASIVGFHVQVDPDIGLERNEWIRVTGTIRIKEMLYYGNSYDFPVFTDGLILRCSTPDLEDAYIYP